MTTPSYRTAKADRNDPQPAAPPAALQAPDDLPLFSGLTSAPVSPGEPPPGVSHGASILFTFYQKMCASPPHVCTASAAQLASAVGIPEQSIAGLRRELVRMGLIVVGRPVGASPEVKAVFWRMLDSRPMIVSERVLALETALLELADDAGVLTRILSELGDEGEAGRFAGVCASLRQAAIESRRRDGVRD